MIKITKKQQEICDTWDNLLINEPNISTDKLIKKTSNICNIKEIDIVQAIVRAFVSRNDLTY